MEALGALIVLAGLNCAGAVPVLFIIFIIKAIRKRSKKWIGISAAICASLVLPLILIGGSVMPETEPPSTALETEITSTTQATTTAEPPPVTEATTTAPPETTTVATTKATTTEPPATTTVTTTTKATTKKTTTRPPETTTTEPPVTFEEIYIAYQENELRATETYKGETICISGTVTEVSSSFMGTTTVTLDIYAQGQKHWVLCSFVTKENKDDLMELNVGDYVTIEGMCLNWWQWSLCKVVD